MKPPTLADAAKRGLLAMHHTEGIHTFSNGTQWECWADGNCYACRYWDADVMGDACAFEGAAFMHIATPDLARMFGWLRREGNTQDGERFGWTAPESCRFFQRRRDDDGNDLPEPPEPDPLQLVLIADPTEDAAVLVSEPEREAVTV